MRTLSLIFLSLVLISYACHSPSPQENDAAMHFTDSYGRDVNLKSKPQRIISLSPTITETIFLLQGEKRLVGISDFCTYPSETKKIEHIGGLQNINVEKLLSLQPDLILIGSIVSKGDVEKMERAGLTVLAIKHEKSLDEIYPLLQTIGQILGKDSLAESKITDIKRQRTQWIRDTTHLNRPSVYYVVGFGEAGDFTSPGCSHIDEIISLAGGDNVGRELSSWNISREFLFKKDPDLIFIRKEDFQTFNNTYPYTKLSAVKAGRVYPIESGWIDNISPRNDKAIAYMKSKVNLFSER